MVQRQVDPPEDEEEEEEEETEEEEEEEESASSSVEDDEVDDGSTTKAGQKKKKKSDNNKKKSHVCSTCNKAFGAKSDLQVCGPYDLHAILRDVIPSAHLRKTPPPVTGMHSYVITMRLSNDPCLFVCFTETHKDPHGRETVSFVE